MKRPLLYILDKDNNPIPATDPVQAGRLLLEMNKRRVALDEIVVEDYAITIVVSTIFLVIDQNHSPDGPPVLFESIIINGDLNLSREKYCTWKEAEQGHKKMVTRVKNNLWVNRILDRTSVKTKHTRSITKKIVRALQQELKLKS